MIDARWPLLIAGALLVAGCLFFKSELVALQQHNIDLLAEQTLTPTRLYHRPPIHKCPNGVDTWECIRHAMWRKEI